MESKVACLFDKGSNLEVTCAGLVKSKIMRSVTFCKQEARG